MLSAPKSKLIGKPLGDLEFRSRYRVWTLAMRHRGEALTTDLASRSLDFGDTLLVAGDWADIGKLWDDRNDFVVLTLPAEYQERLPARQRAPLAIGILIVMVAVMAFELIPNSAAALIAALAMIASGCVRLDAIYRIISWKTVVLIAGMLPLATALTKTGASDLMAKELVATLGSLGPIAMLAVVFLVTALVGLFVSNSATAVLISPIAIDAAQTLHVSPYAFAIKVFDCLLHGLRNAGIISGEHAGDGTGRLRLWRLRQGGCAATVADNDYYGRIGRGALSRVGRRCWLNRNGGNHMPKNRSQPTPSLTVNRVNTATVIRSMKFSISSASLSSSRTALPRRKSFLTTGSS